MNCIYSNIKTKSENDDNRQDATSFHIVTKKAGCQVTAWIVNLEGEHYD